MNILYIILFSFLTPFLIKEISPNSMQVLYKVIQNVEIPKEFVSKYLNHVMKKFREEKSEEGKKTIARQFAYFLTNLIEYDHINMDEEILKDVSLYFYILDR